MTALRGKVAYLDATAQADLVDPQRVQRRRIRYSHQSRVRQRP
jgi:hypothetical protein